MAKLEIFLLAVILLQPCRSLTNFADVPCGRRPAGSRNPKIVGGEEAREGEFPWLVSMTRRGGHFCGGSLITNRHVLTAAHCVCSSTNSIMSASQIRVTLGQHRIDKPEPYKFDVGVASVVTHPDYRCTAVKNDIAILEFDKPISWTQLIVPACLPEGPSKFAGITATVAGWGWTNEDTQQGTRSNYVKKAAVNVLDLDTCRNWYKLQGKKAKIQDTQMCAGFENGGVDSCWADSGGPLMVDGDSKDQLMVVGVVSTGIGCARPYLPGLYTRVSDYIPWIDQVLNESVIN